MANTMEIGVYRHLGQMTEERNDIPSLSFCPIPGEYSETTKRANLKGNQAWNDNQLESYIDDGTGQPKLNLHHFRLVFIILIPGFSLAILAFIWELIMGWNIKKA